MASIPCAPFSYRNSRNRMSSASDFSSSPLARPGDSASPDDFEPDDFEPDVAGPDIAHMLASMPGIIPVDDAAFAAAYEATGDVDRARLKTCIARLHVLYGAAGGAGAGDLREERTAMRWRQGFTSLEQVSPCAWALVCVDAAWASAPRLLAAVLPAVFAGVGAVAVVRAGGTGPWPAPVLAALELAGQEVVADVAPEALPALLEALAAGAGAGGMMGAGGRLLLLGEHPDHISALAHARGVPAWRDARSPIIGCVPRGDATSEPDRPDNAALRAAHPDATFMDVPAQPRPTARTASLAPFVPLSAIACAPAHASAWLNHAALVLGPGHEWCWMHPGLFPDWFARRVVALLPASPSPGSSGMS